MYESEWVKRDRAGQSHQRAPAYLNSIYSIPQCRASKPLENSIEPHAVRFSLFFHVALRFLPFNMNDWRESLMYIAAVESKTRFESIQSFLDFFSLTRSITFRCIRGCVWNICVLLIEIRSKRVSERYEGCNICCTVIQSMYIFF